MTDRRIDPTTRAHVDALLAVMDAQHAALYLALQRHDQVAAQLARNALQLTYYRHDAALFELDGHLLPPVPASVTGVDTFRTTALGNP